MPWGEDGKTASFDMCICCGVDFGYQDSLPESTREYREIWAKAGYPWVSKSQRPANWSVEAQLANIPDRFK